MELMNKASQLRKQMEEEYSIDRVVKKHESLYMRLAGC